MADLPRDARLVRIMKDLALTRVPRLCEALRHPIGMDYDVSAAGSDWTGTDRVDAMLDRFCRCPPKAAVLDLRLVVHAIVHSVTLLGHKHAALVSHENGSVGFLAGGFHSDDPLSRTLGGFAL